MMPIPIFIQSSGYSGPLNPHVAGSLFFGLIGLAIWLFGSEVIEPNAPRLNAHVPFCAVGGLLGILSFLYLFIWNFTRITF